MVALLLLLLLTCRPLAAQTPLELIEEGRFAEARQQVEGVDSLARYQDYLAARSEADGARACSLYQLVSYRYPGTDVDRLAQERLLAFQEWGQSLPLFIAPGRSGSAQLQRPEELKPGPEELQSSELPLEVAAPPEPTEPEVKAVTEVEKAEPPKPEGEKALGIRLETAAPTKIIERPPPRETETKEETAPREPPREEPAPSTPPEPTVIPEPSVRPVTAPPTTPHDIGPQQGGPVWIQVGAFGVRQNADRLAAKLRNAGFPVTIVSKQSTKTLLHHVRVGGYPTREAARPVAEKLKQSFGLAYHFVEM
jgi:cell division septation protein DedD